MRAIDADHLKRWILSRVFKTQLSVADVIDQIDREDTIVPEQKKGYWTEDMKDEYWGMWYRCSECGKSAIRGNFCPNCGADMRG